MSFPFERESNLTPAFPAVFPGFSSPSSSEPVFLFESSSPNPLRKAFSLLFPLLVLFLFLFLSLFTAEVKVVEWAHRNQLPGLYKNSTTEVKVVE